MRHDSFSARQRRRVRVLISTGVLALALAPTVFSQESVSPSSVGSGDAARPDPPSSREESTLRQRLGVLTDSALRVRDDAVAGQVHEALASLRKPEGLELMLAQRDGRHRLHVATGSGFVCWSRQESDGSGGTSCAVTAYEYRALAAGDVAAAVDWTEGGFRVTGLVPAGTREVGVAMPDGSVLDAGIVHNTFSVAITKPPEGVVWSTNDGSVRRWNFPKLDR